jgi:C4-dicarboxylate transporter DctM subunit
MIVVGAAKLFSWLLAYTGVPQAVSAFVLANVSDALVFLLVVNVLLLIIGMFLEANAALVMLVPVLYPIALALGVDPVHFGVVVVLNLCIGLITPPVGLCLNIACMIARSPLERGSVAILPFLAAALAVLLLVTLVPQASLLLPGLAAG